MAKATLSLKQEGTRCSMELRYESGDVQSSEFNYATEEDANLAMTNAVIVAVNLGRKSLSDSYLRSKPDTRALAL